jgi:hypothetical protein
MKIIAMKSLLYLITVCIAADNSFVRDVGNMLDKMLIKRGPDPNVTCEFALAYPTIATHCSDGTLTFDKFTSMVSKDYRQGISNRTVQLESPNVFRGFKTFR